MRDLATPTTGATALRLSARSCAAAAAVFAGDMAIDLDLASAALGRFEQGDLDLDLHVVATWNTAATPREATEATPEAAEATQGAGARRLGRKLLVDAARRDRTWPDRNLAPCLFDSRSAVPDTLLTPSNFEEVAYATTRMLHAWPTPAWVAGAAHIDGSYTCLCPAVELAAMGYRDVIAIATEPGPIPRSMFTDDVIPARVHGARIRIVQPDADLREIGADFLTATRQGVEAGFELGRRKAREFLTTAY